MKIILQTEAHGEKVVKLLENTRWNGTIVQMQIPTKAPQGFNLYDYIQ